MQLTVISDEDVCFTAYLSSYPGSNVPSVIIYDRVITNKGSGYNTADGLFTVPRDGTYLFLWNSMTASGHYCNLYLYKNGANAGLSAYSDSRSANTDSGSMTMVLELSTGDRIWIQSVDCGYIQTVYGWQHISFSGCKT